MTMREDRQNEEICWCRNGPNPGTKMPAEPRSLFYSCRRRRGRRWRSLMVITQAIYRQSLMAIGVME